MVYATLEEAEFVSNQMYLALNPEGTTELLHGAIQVEGGWALAGEEQNPAE